ncbi:hypothetical protein [Megalodesulfovibrio gigas]|uniref:Uncharacterized protein n=1 Tax=Megalodesulfovibrio gigas (strain ATCC 19364 / DSM 1382 / NCIMB 9332 / VKM B-1759) TaxID=1121448 RepID=T2GE27_MEGG1|nr:hypothetical protein [Megalodesulfovibrio gigas]AGW14142.1 hypothetical protein DGI_2393 [Megalodesulfovibrio gigas DSM 1382 = ATCC 19364]
MKPGLRQYASILTSSSAASGWLALHEAEDVPPPARTWPCRCCGVHSANRLHCPDCLSRLTRRGGLDASLEAVHDGGDTLLDDMEVAL